MPAPDKGKLRAEIIHFSAWSFSHMRLPNHKVMRVLRLSLTLANFGPLQVAWLHAAAAVLQVLASRELGTMCGSVSSVKAG